jgi:hypothetical protein
MRSTNDRRAAPRGCALVLLALVCGAPAARGEEAVAPKLDAVQAPTSATGDVTPAQPLPSMVTICVDRSLRECWSTAGKSTCRESAHPHGEVFSSVSATGDSGAPLRGCWESLRQ